MNHTTTYTQSHSLVKKSQWIFGRIQAPVKLGNGWGYDIGFGGLDHVLASGEDVCRMTQEPVARVEKPCVGTTPQNKSNAVSNVVVDTEVYSNTGGQSSNEQNFQRTFCPAGAVAKLSAKPTAHHATSGKKNRKTVAQSESRGSLLTMPSQSNVTESKDLGMIAKSYGYVYSHMSETASGRFAMVASQAQYFNVIKEAEAYHGPSLIICYALCIWYACEHCLNQSDEVSCRRPCAP